MHGSDRQTGQLFSYLSSEAMVPKCHPLRMIRKLGNAALEPLSPIFGEMYSAIGRPSISPVQLLRALLLQAFFTVRSERQLMEQLGYNMLFRRFVELPMDAPVWEVTVFTKSRDRLLDGDVAREFLAALLADPRVKPLLSDEHFSRRWRADRSLGLDEELPAKGRQRRAASARGRVAGIDETNAVLPVRNLADSEVIRADADRGNSGCVQHSWRGRKWVDGR